MNLTWLFRESRDQRTKKNIQEEEEEEKSNNNLKYRFSLRHTHTHFSIVLYLSSHQLACSLAHLFAFLWPDLCDFL